MHDGLQLGTLVLVLFGILLNRYDFNAVRKEVTELRKDVDTKLDVFRKDVDIKLDALRKDVDTKLDSLRNEFLRRTDAIVSTQFSYSERIAVIETKLDANQ